MPAQALAPTVAPARSGVPGQASTRPLQPLNAAQPIGSPTPFGGAAPHYQPAPPPSSAGPDFDLGPVAPSAATVRPIRVALTGEVIDDARPVPAAAYGIAPMPTPTGPGLTAGSLPNAAIAPVMLQNVVSDYAVPLGERWEKCLAFSLPLLAGALAIVHAAPDSYLWVVLGALILLGLIMGATGALPSYDDSLTDCVAVFLVTIFVGPMLGLVGYLVVSTIKRECNGALVALLAVDVIVPPLLAIGLVDGIGSMERFAVASVLVSAGLTGLVIRLGGWVLSFAGWLLSSFFRPINE